MKKKWLLKDLIDLEYFLQVEKGNDEFDRQEQDLMDREIYLQYIEQNKAKTGLSTSKRALIKFWLDKRRDMAKKQFGSETYLPGNTFNEVHRLMLYLFIIAGFFVGTGLSSSLLNYTGDSPLNISVYIGILVFGQIFLIFLMGIFLFLRSQHRIFIKISVLYSLINLLFTKLISKFKENAVKKLPTKHQNNIESTMGLLKGKKQVYGTLFHWPIFIMAQIFGIGFNLGTLTITLLKILSMDLAFGWQSTIQFSSHTVYTIIKVMSYPWVWFLPQEIAHPTFEQIEGSKIILKEGISLLSTQNLVSWWPFLCLAVLFYGLLPRVILFAAGIFLQKTALKKLTFDHAACDKLIMRMKTPGLSTQGQLNENKKNNASHDNPLSSVKEKSMFADKIAEDDTIVLIPDDIFDQCPLNELNSILKKTLSLKPTEKIRIGIDPDEDNIKITDIGKKLSDTDTTKTLLLQEAWLPPIRENLLFIQEMRKILGPKYGIIIGLIGKPSTNTIFTPIDEKDRKIWEQEISKLGDAYIRTEELEKK